MMGYDREYYSDTLDLWSMIIIRLRDQSALAEQHRKEIIHAVLVAQTQTQLEQMQESGNGFRFRIFVGDWIPADSAMFVLCLMRTDSCREPYTTFCPDYGFEGACSWSYGVPDDWSKWKKAALKCLCDRLPNEFVFTVDDGNAALEPLIDADTLGVTWDNDLGWVNLTTFLSKVDPLESTDYPLKT